MKDKGTLTIIAMIISGGILVAFGKEIFKLIYNW